MNTNAKKRRMQKSFMRQATPWKFYWMMNGLMECPIVVSCLDMWKRQSVKNFGSDNWSPQGFEPGIPNTNLKPYCYTDIFSSICMCKDFNKTIN
jgi:hypothetical protein